MSHDRNDVSSEDDISHSVSLDGHLTSGGLCSGIEEQPRQSRRKKPRKPRKAWDFEDDRGGPNIIGGI